MQTSNFVFSFFFLVFASSFYFLFVSCNDSTSSVGELPQYYQGRNYEDQISKKAIELDEQVNILKNSLGIIQESSVQKESSSSTQIIGLDISTSKNLIDSFNKFSLTSFSESMKSILKEVKELESVWKNQSQTITEKIVESFIHREDDNEEKDDLEIFREFRKILDTYFPLEYLARARSFLAPAALHHKNDAQVIKIISEFDLIFDKMEKLASLTLRYMLMKINTNEVLENLSDRLVNRILVSLQVVEGEE